MPYAKGSIHVTELIPNIVNIMIVIIVIIMIVIIVIIVSNTHKQEVDGKHYATALGWVT